MNKCNYCNHNLSEYPCAMPACIRNKQPDCLAKAVIPSITVNTVDGITNLANCFVHVTDINTTYYVDDKHRPMIIWAGDVEVDLPPSIQTEEQWKDFIKSFKLKGQFLYIKFYSEGDNKNLIDSFYFTNKGNIYWAGEFEEAVDNGGLV